MDRKKPRQTKIKIGKDTTHLTEPLDEEGYVDYIAALNERYSRGVTPENNAAVLFWRVWGAKDVDEKRRPELFKKLGIDPLPVEGDYFLSLQQVAAANAQEPAVTEDLNRQQDQAMQRPWKADEFPAIARWLLLNDRQLATIVEGTKRSKFYSPALLSDDDDPIFNSMIGILLPMAQQSREFGRALQARAMLHLGERRTDDAWQDLVACHRLGRLIGQGPSMVEGMIGFAIDGMACRGDAALAHYGKLTPARSV